MLFKFFLILFLIGFTLVSLLGISVLRSFRDFFFGSPKSRNRQRQATQSSQKSSAKSSTRNQQANRKKVIADNEGEYVDYVEIKD